MSTTTNRKLANMVVIVNWILFALLVLGYFVFMGASLIYFDDVAKYVTKMVQETDEAKEADEEKILETARAVLTIVLIVVGIAGLIAILIELALNLLLTKGVNQSNRRKCNIWLIINLVFFILGALGIVVRLFKVFSGDHSVLSFIIDLIFLIWLGISLLIIKNLRDDLTNSPPTYGGVVYTKADNQQAV